jgi:hypothetical protein
MANEIVQGDNGSILQIRITDNSQVIDLTETTVSVVITYKSTGIIKPANITKPTEGVCEVILNSEDVQFEGIYSFQAQVLYSDGRKFTSKVGRFSVIKKIGFIPNTGGTGNSGVKTIVTDSNVNGYIIVDGLQIQAYNDSEIKQDILTLQGSRHSHENLDSLNRLGVNSNNKLTIDGIEQVGGSGSTTNVQDSTLNGNILINGQEVVIYDDTSIRTSLQNKSDVGHSHTEYALASLVTELQSQLKDALDRITILEGGDPNAPQIEWEFDFTVNQSQGFYVLKNDSNWNQTMTIEDIYGDNLDGANAKVKLYTLGVVDGEPDEQKELPRKGFDTFSSPSMHGQYEYDHVAEVLYFESMAMNPYYFKLVKYK